jgi:hypothetical protein
MQFDQRLTDGREALEQLVSHAPIDRIGREEELDPDHALVMAVWRALEGAVLADLVAQSTAGSGTTPADVVAALGTVAAAYAPGNLVIAGSTAFSKLLTAYPLGLGDSDSPTSWGAIFLPVADATFASKVLVTNRANIHVLASDLKSLLAGFVPSKLGIDVGVYAEAVGLVDVKTGAIVMTLA